MLRKKILVVLISIMLILNILPITNIATAVTDDNEEESLLDETSDETRAEIEEELNLANNEDYTWSYDESTDSWVMSIVTAVVNPEIEDEQGVSVCVPGAYVVGIDTDRDGIVDITSNNYDEEVNGNMVIDEDGTITSSNGQVYTATSCPVIINTGAAGYSSSTNSVASTTYAEEGYINVACGNRGKQDTAENDDGDEYYTGDSPSCLVDQKNAVRFVKYNILLGNLPGSVDYFVSTGGSGGGAFATMLAATSNNEDYYDYEIEAGAVGVYRNSDGSYSTTVTIDGVDYEISDGVWGSIAYSAITSLYSADMALAFEYYLNECYEFNTDFQDKLAEILSAEYMDYINEQNLSVNEADVELDINGDGDTDDVIELTIEYDEEEYSDTNGYGGTYLDFYLAEFVSNLQWYIDNLDYAEGWTWFDEDGNALSDDEVANMSSNDKAVAFIEGRYSSSDNDSSIEGDIPSGKTDGTRTYDGDVPDDLDENMAVDAEEISDDVDGEILDGDLPDDVESLPGDLDGDVPSDARGDISELPGDTDIDIDEEDEVGTPDEGTTQSATSSSNSANYSSFEEMYEAYKSDIESIEEGDKYGNNIVDLYDPMQYIGAETTENPTWTKIIMGASEGDMSMFSSLNLQAKWLEAGTDCVIEWQWNGGHVPSEVLGDSFTLYIDQMYGEYVSGITIEKEDASIQETNGTATEATGDDISSWVDYDDTTSVSFSLADAVSYRTAGASKAMPGFDVIDYGQEDYVFGDSDSDARHWDRYVLTAFEENYTELENLFDADILEESTTEYSCSKNVIKFCVILAILIVVLVIMIVRCKSKKKK